MIFFVNLSVNTASRIKDYVQESSIIIFIILYKYSQYRTDERSCSRTDQLWGDEEA